jgi:hypothetical protein
MNPSRITVHIGVNIVMVLALNMCFNGKALNEKEKCMTKACSKLKKHARWVPLVTPKQQAKKPNGPTKEPLATGSIVMRRLNKSMVIIQKEKDIISAIVEEYIQKSDAMDEVILLINEAITCLGNISKPVSRKPEPKKMPKEG